MEGLPRNLPELEEPSTIFLLTKATKFLRGLTIDVSKPTPGFMLQIDFVFFNVEIIPGFTSTFVAICYATSHPFVFSPIKKHLLIDILEFLVPKLRNQDKKVALIQIDEAGALARSSEFRNTFHKMNITVQTIGEIHLHSIVKS